MPRLTAESFRYLGGFRLPAESSNGDSFSFGGKAMAFSPATNSLFVSSRAGRVAEVTIPNVVNSADVTALPFASFLQPFADPTEGRLSQVSSDGVALDSLMVYNNRLYGTATIYYDANNTQSLSHYSHSLQLNQLSFSGWSRVWEAGKTGFVAGFMSLVPAEWQARLGGPAATGQCCIPVVNRTSWGPAAFAFDPAQVGQATVPASPLLYYTSANPTLGSWDASNPTYGATIQMGGMAIIGGTRTAVYIGRNGIGPNCYGNGTSIQSLDGTMGVDGAHWCYDPTSGDKGSHAYPYRYQIWAYDLNDFAAVKEGRKQPWEVVPYGVWPLNLPTPEATVKVGGVGYDAERKVLYVTQLLADRDGYSNRPVIHSIQIDVASYEFIKVDTTPAPAPSAPTTGIALDANKVSPQPSGTAITFTAAPAGGVAPHAYKWWIFEGGWKPVGSWTASNTFTWTPTAANANGRVTVWVRSAGATVDESQAQTALDMVIVDATAAAPAPAPTPAPAPAVTSPNISGVTIAANKVAPQAPGTAITFSATPTGGTAHQYKWWIYEDGWKVMADWTTSSTFTWTPAAVNPSGRVTVWVRNGGNTDDVAQSQAAMDMLIANAPVPVVRVSAVTMGANKIAPQPAGSPVTFTALPAGGTAPYQYKWWIYEDGWKVVGSWTTANTFTWTPTAANALGRVTVWVRSAGATADEAHAQAAMDFVINAATVTAPVVTAPVATGSSYISAVALSANLVAPQLAGTPVTFTAVPTGGIAPQYKWWIFEDGWKAVANWNTSNTFTWAPTAANPNGRITVWVRNGSNTADEAEGRTAMDFVIK